jgi:hypothetical protein
MENVVFCPVCHLQVRPTDYFCFNCGKNLRSKPLSTSLNQQIIMYLESFFLPPYGLIIGMRYLKQKDDASKIVGVVAIILTVISILVFIKVTQDLIKTINTKLNTQLQDIGY